MSINAVNFERGLGKPAQALPMVGVEHETGFFRPVPPSAEFPLALDLRRH